MTGSGRCFDAYVVVDWSASNVPVTGTDSIWIAVVDHDRDRLLSNPPTRRRAERELIEILDRRADRRTLLGVDFALGYPAGTAAALGLRGTPWRAMWDELSARLDDDERNRNTRFALASSFNQRIGSPPGPFWGCPVAAGDGSLTARKPAARGLAEFRACEQALRAARLRPKSVWQLFGNGAVGGQTLTGIPVLRRLVDHLATAADVWPFTTGLGAPPSERPGVVVAELWPSRFAVDHTTHPVKDAAQVIHAAHALAAADSAGTLGGWFAPEVTGGVRRAAEREEAWILGPPLAPAVA